MAESTKLDPEYVAKLREDLGAPIGSVSKKAKTRVEVALANGDPLPGTAADRSAVEKEKQASREDRSRKR